MLQSCVRASVTVCVCITIPAGMWGELSQHTAVPVMCSGQTRGSIRAASTYIQPCRSCALARPGVVSGQRLHQIIYIFFLYIYIEGTVARFVFNKSVFCLKKPEAVRKTTTEVGFLNSEELSLINSSPM